MLTLFLFKFIDIVRLLLVIFQMVKCWVSVKLPGEMQVFFIY